MEGFLILLGLVVVLSGPAALIIVLRLSGRLADAERLIIELRAQARTAQALPGAAPAAPQQPEAEAVERQAVERAPEQPEETPASEPIPESAAAPAGGWSPEAIGWPRAPQPEDAPARDSRSFEERLGARWTVWVGGVALALGGLLLVRYSIEQGYFGPVARCAMGLLFGLALVAGGEFLRRREKTGLPTQTPAILTAAGTVAAFGAVYAAHGLYELIGSAVAFVALGAIALAAMFAAALHGPALAGLGLVGALGAPLLVTSSQPNPWPVVLYIAAATAAAYALSRIRRWLWLARAAAIGAGLWAWAFVLQGSPNFFHAALVQTLVSTALAAAFIAVLPHLATSDEDARFDSVATGFVGGFAALAAYVSALGAAQGYFDLVATILLAAEIAGLAFVGAFVAPVAAATPIAGALAAAVLWVWIGDAEHPVRLSTVATLHEPVEPMRFALFALVGAAVVAGFGARRLASGRALSGLVAGFYAGAAAVTPPALLAIVWLRLGRSEESLPFALLAGLLAAGFALLAGYFRRGDAADAPPAARLALGAFATAALAALALGFVFVFDKGVLTVALAMSALAAAAVATRLDIAALRWAVAVMGFVVLGRLAWEPRIVGAALGTTPVFNWLLFGYGVPALAFGAAARRMRLAGGEDLPVRVAQSLCIVFSAQLAVFEIRHALNGGDIYRADSRLMEQGLFALTALLFSLVLTRLDLMRASPVFRIASMVAGAASALVAAFGLAFWANPYLHCRPVEGGVVFNALLLGYGAPALAAAVLMRQARGVRPAWFVQGAGLLSLVLLFAYACLQTRRFFHDATICAGQGHGQVEIWAYSAVWLALGAALLIYGAFRHTQGARVASGVFVLAATLKVFLYDLSGLQGLMRALSFIGLGLVLIAIGLLYQKLVFRSAAAPQAGAPEPGAQPDEPVV